MLGTLKLKSESPPRQIESKTGVFRIAILDLGAKIPPKSHLGLSFFSFGSSLFIFTCVLKSLNGDLMLGEAFSYQHNTNTSRFQYWREIKLAIHITP